MTVSEILKAMAEIAWTNQLKAPNSLKRNTLLKPMLILFDQIRKQQLVLDMEALRAASIQKISDHLDRVSDYRRSNTTRKAIEEFVNFFFIDLIEKSYHGKIHRIISDEKDLKAVYLFYLRSHIGKKEESK